MMQLNASRSAYVEKNAHCTSKPPYCVFTCHDLLDMTCREILDKVEDQPMVLSYEAASRISGLSIPEEQAAFLYEACGIREFVIVAQTMIVSYDSKGAQTFRFPEPMSEHGPDSKKVLELVARHWRNLERAA